MRTKLKMLVRESGGFMKRFVKGYNRKLKVRERCFNTNNTSYYIDFDKRIKDHTRSRIDVDKAVDKLMGILGW